MSIKESKIKTDIQALKDMPDGHPMDWLKAPWDVHHWTDMFVESSRAAPYLMGHVWAIYLPLSVLLIILT